jgi:zinc transport system substrate-binding protein
LKISYFILALLLLLSNASFSETKLLTSIRPLALIAQELAHPTDTVEQLLPINASPHYYQLKPSDRKKVDTADLIIWVGEELETPLAKLLGQKGGKTITISDLKAIHWPESVSGGGHQHGDHFHSRDPHVWLDPRNLSTITSVLAKALIKRSPENTAYYQNKKEEINLRLEALDKQLASQLSPIKGKAFIVLHPAYGHFVERYGLDQIDFIVQTPERGLGAKHLFQLRKHNNVKCVFSETGISKKIVEQIADHLDVNKGELDPLGVNLPADARTEAIILAIADQMQICLGG